MKARIARQFRRYDFPDKKIVNDAHTHDLIAISRLEEARLQHAGDDAIFRRNWDLATLWSEESRYRTTDKAQCKALLDAIMEENHGLLPWIKGLW